jgi:peroxiredoxin
MPFMALVALIVCGIASAYAAPVNDFFANRTVIPPTNSSGLVLTNITLTGDNSGATRESGEPLHASVTGGASVWWSWKAPREGTVTLSTTGSVTTLGSQLDTVLAVYTGNTLANLMEEASNDDQDYSNAVFTSRAVFDVVANRTYQIAVDGWDGASGNIHLSLQLGPLAAKPAAPAWTLVNPRGGTVYSTNYAGKVVMLDFFGVWCGPCTAEMSNLVSLQAQYGGVGLAVVGADVSWGGDTTQIVTNFMATNVPAINFPMVMSTAATESAYGVAGSVPTTFIIDRNNLIRRKFVGVQTRAMLEHAILPLLYDNLRLASQYATNQLTLRWPTNASPFRLQTTTNITGTWTNWSGTIEVLNGTNKVTVNMSGPPRFYRLATD